MLKRIFTLLMLCYITPQAIDDSLVFSFNPETFSKLIDNSLNKVGTIKIAPNGDYVDFSQEGSLSATVNFPQGPFSYEIYFKLDDFNNSDPYISNLIGGGKWTYTQTYGAASSVGGGYLYPVLPEEYYSGNNNYVSPKWEKYERANISKCLYSFTIGARNSVAWKQIYSNKCIESNKWNHVIATSNGNKMNLFVNGVEETDSLRIQGGELTPNIDSELTINIGGNQSQDRFIPSKVKIALANIYSKALSQNEIQEKYFKISGIESRCKIYINVVSPVAGEVITKSTKFEIEIKTIGDCSVPDVLSGNIVLEVSTNPNFLGEVQEIKIVNYKFTFNEIISQAPKWLSQVCFWRFKNKSPFAEKGLLKKTVAAEPEVLSGIIPTLIPLETTTLIHQSKIKPKFGITHGSIFLENKLYTGSFKLLNLQGKTVLSAFENSQNDERSKIKERKGLYILKIAQSSSQLIVLP